MRPALIKEMVDALLKQQDEQKELLDHTKGAIKALQNNCPHEWEYAGSDSHNDYEKCKWCGKDR